MLQVLFHCIAEQRNKTKKAQIVLVAFPKCRSDFRIYNHRISVSWRPDKSLLLDDGAPACEVLRNRDPLLSCPQLSSHWPCF